MSIGGAPGLGLIGVGHWGRHLARNFSSLNALAAFADTCAEARADCAARYPGAAIHDSASALIAEADIEAVVIATPAATHGALVDEALTAGKHVFVEKPLCLDVGEARKLKSKAEQVGLTLMVGHLMLYHPAFIALKSTFEAGTLGNLRYIHSNRLSLGKIRREETVLWSFAPHDISMILQLTGHMPNRVSTHGGHFLRPGIADPGSQIRP